jgi:hypothetical protein
MTYPLPKRNSRSPTHPVQRIRLRFVRSTFSAVSNARKTLETQELVETLYRKHRFDAKEPK